MRGRLRLLLLLLLGIRHLAAAPPLGYYDSAQGKSGHALRQALHNIIRNHTVILYDGNGSLDTVDAVKDLDEDPADTNNVILVYAGWPGAQDKFWHRQRMEPRTSLAEQLWLRHRRDHNLAGKCGTCSICGPAMRV